MQSREGVPQYLQIFVDDQLVKVDYISIIIQLNNFTNILYITLPWELAKNEVIKFHSGTGYQIGKLIN